MQQAGKVYYYAWCQVVIFKFYAAVYELKHEKLDKAVW